MSKMYKKTIFVLLLLFCILILIEMYIIYFGFTSKPQKSDCIIILGCRVYGTIPSPFLAARLDEALRLYHEGYGEYIIVSGGQGVGEDISEAQSMKSYLEKKGVAPDRILLEDKSTSTSQNIAFSSKKMHEHGFKTAVIVSNTFHLKRISVIAKHRRIQASYSGVYLPQHKSNELYGFIREVPALIKAFITGE